MLGSLIEFFQWYISLKMYLCACSIYTLRQVHFFDTLSKAIIKTIDFDTLKNFHLEAF